jgi:thiol-disulfide isomerase/thioredoxin
MNTRVVLLLVVLATARPVQAQTVRGVWKLSDLQKRLSNADTLYVVNFWATWCKPCVAELPAFDSLYLWSAGKPVSVLLVSLDFVEELGRRVNPFLRARKIRTPCYLLDETDGNVFINAVSPDWSGAIPGTLFKLANKKIFREKNMGLKELESTVSGMSAAPHKKSKN